MFHFTTSTLVMETFKYVGYLPMDTQKHTKTHGEHEEVFITSGGLLYQWRHTATGVIDTHPMETRGNPSDL